MALNDQQTQEAVIELLKLIGKSKLPSELHNISAMPDSEFYFHIQSGAQEGKRIGIEKVRGFAGSYNPNTNTPALSNGTGTEGEYYVVSTNGSRDFGNGSVSLAVNDIIKFEGGLWRAKFNANAVTVSSDTQFIDLGDIGVKDAHTAFNEAVEVSSLDIQTASKGLVVVKSLDRRWIFTGESGVYDTNTLSEPGDFLEIPTDYLKTGGNTTDNAQSLRDGIDANTQEFQRYILIDEKGQPQGVATLDSTGKLTSAQLPDLAITDVIVAAETTIADFATNSGNYTFEQGDVIIIDDNGSLTHYIYKGGDKTDVNEYSEISASEIDISQVNGLQAALDAKETPQGAQDKADTAEDNAMDAINAIDIGSRNYWLNGDFRTDLLPVNGTDSSFSLIEDPRALFGARVFKAEAPGSYTGWYTQEYLNLIEGEEYTFSFYVFVSQDWDGDQIAKIESLNSGNKSVRFSDGGIVRGQWNKVYLTFKNEFIGSKGSRLLIYPRFTTQGYLLFDGVKVEQGNKVTDWTPAPEDQVTDYLQEDEYAWDYLKNRDKIASKDYVDSLDTSKELKEITNTPQYTVVAEDVDKVLDFTANAGEEIDLIINTGVITANKSIQFISSGNNVVIPVTGSGVTLAQTEGSKLKSRGKGSFVEILSTMVAETFAVTGDLQKDVISGKDIDLKNPNTSSEIKFYDNETNELVYFYMRYNAAENIFEIGSNESDPVEEVTSMFFDRGKDFTVSKGYFRSLSQQYGLILQAPSGNPDFKNPTGNLAIKATDNSIQVWRIGSAAGTIPDTLLWDSANSGGGGSGDGTDGVDGKSAYQVWLDNGNTGTEQDFLNSLIGADGTDGVDGDSAYEIWLSQGNTGTEQDFLDSLKGADGTGGDGGSADGNNYHTAIDFSAGTIILSSNNGAGIIQENLDGRWAKLGGDTFTGEVKAPVFSETSLRKLKKNIKPFSKSGIGLLEKLDIVTFDRKDGTANDKIGIIADDSPKEFLNESMDGVDLYKTIFVQAKAIQELKEELYNLKERIDGKVS